MCGICGVINYNLNSEIRKDVLSRMCAAMIHRGPDDEGIYINNISGVSIGLGHRRLKIIDLSSTGHQPMSNEDETVWIVFNGEVYNYKDLRSELENKGHIFKSKTDTETVIHLYEEYGENCVKYLRGMFAFAIWDEKQYKLILVRDRLGKKPLLYYWNSQYLCFASEFTSLFASGLVDKKINYRMVDPYLTFGYIPAPNSIYEGVFKLLPGHLAIFEKNRLTVDCYWQVDYEKKVNIDENEAAEELEKIITDAVELRLQSDVPLGVFLSGGLDSSMIVAIMAKFQQKIKTFSIGFTEEAYNELHYAAEIAKRYHTEHHELIITPKATEVLSLLVKHYGEPYADSSAIPSYYVANETKKFVTVALNGDGGDESFVGYERYQAMYLAQAYCRLPGFLRENIFDKIFDRIPDSIHFYNPSRRLRRFFKGTQLPWRRRYMRWVSIFSDDLKNEIYEEDFKNNFANEDTLLFLKPYLDRFGKLDLLDTLLLTDISTNLPNDLVVKMDIATMANSLEGRSPFLDQEVVQFMAGLPTRLKFKGLEKKYLIKKIAKKYLPRDIIYRPKRGFGVPIGYWFRGELKTFITDYLLSSNSFGRNYFKRAAIENLIQQHLTGKVDYSFQIWALLMLELWHQTFID